MSRISRELYCCETCDVESTSLDRILIHVQAAHGANGSNDYDGEFFSLDLDDTDASEAEKEERLKNAR